SLACGQAGRKQQATNNKAQNKQQTTNNIQQTTNNTQQTTHNKQHTTDNRQHTTDNRQQTSSIRENPCSSVAQKKPCIRGSASPCIRSPKNALQPRRESSPASVAIPRQSATRI
ncbi:MAG: hypothetical protein ACK524_23500, partial [Planctomyces sp.]